MPTLSSQHHSFDISLATKYGIEEAIIIHHFQHWIRVNKELKRNLHEGRTWTYQSLDEIAAHFPYLNKSRVYDAIEKLCTGKPRKSKKEDIDFDPVLMKGNFNKTPHDRTVWYAFVEESSLILGFPKMENGESQSPNRENPNCIIGSHTETHTETDKILGADAPKPPNPAFPKRTRLKEAMMEVMPRVFLSASQQEALKKRLEASKITLDEVALHLSDWKVGKGITGGSNDYSAIIKWVIDAVTKEKQTFSDKGKAATQEEGEREKIKKNHADNKKWLEEINKRFRRHIDTNVIRVFADSIEFNLGDNGGRQRFDCAHSHFRQNCLKYLRSLNLDTSGL